MRRLTLGLLLALAPPALAGDRDRKRSIDARIEQLRGHLTEQRHEEDVLRGQVADVTGRIRTLEAEVGDVSLRLRTLEQDLALHEDRLKKLTQLFQLQTKRYDALKQQHKLAVERLNNRLVDIYESDDVTSFDVLFGAASISDALDKFDYMRAVADQDERIARQVALAKRSVRAARARTAEVRASVRQAARAIAVRTAQTREARDELVGATNDLASSKQEKLEDLSQLTAEERAEAE